MRAGSARKRSKPDWKSFATSNAMMMEQRSTLLLLGAMILVSGSDDAKFYHQGAPEQESSFSSDASLVSRRLLLKVPAGETDINSDIINTIITKSSSSSASIPTTQRSLGVFSSQSDGVSCSLSQDVYPAIWDEDWEMYKFPDVGPYLDLSNGTAATHEEIKQALDQIMSELSPNDYELVRLCWCTTYAQLPYEFCPAVFDSCLVSLEGPVSLGGRNAVSCFAGEPRDSLIRTLWPVMLFWTAAVMYAWFFSAHGRSARGFVYRVVCMGCCCLWNPTVVESSARRQLDALLASEPDRASYMYRQRLERLRLQRQQRHERQNQWWYRRYRVLIGSPVSPNDNNNDEDEEKIQLKLTLKTKIFHDDETAAASGLSVPDTTSPSLEDSKQNNNDNDEEENDDDISTMSTGAHCVICLLRLEEGDVVGDIPCGHLLHKDCLKDWLRRKNKCPLCQHSGIATLSLEKE